MDKNLAKKILEAVREDYNLLAKEYTRVRDFISEDIKKLLEYANEGEKILDSGCAFGRLYKGLEKKNVDYYGIDFSEKLIEIAKRKFPNAKFQTVNALNLPFPDNFFDKVYSISVLHHIPSKNYRLQYLKEIKRVLKPEGLLLLRVWDCWKNKEKLKLILKNAILKLIGISKLDFFDIFFPWKNGRGNVIAKRYFHCFLQKELEGLIRKTGFAIIKCWREGKDLHANIYLIAKKPL